MLISVTHSQTSVILRVKLRDSAVSTGAGKTGLSSSSSGLIISTIADNEASATVYAQASSNVETIATLGIFAAPTADKCRFKEVDATNHKGIYEIQIADARFAVSGAKSLLVSISGVSGVAECDVVVPLDLPVKLGNTAHGGTSGTLTLERIIVASTTTNEPAMKLTGDGGGAGLFATGGYGIVAAGDSTTGTGIYATGGTSSGYGMELAAGSNALQLTTTDGGDGIHFTGSLGGSLFVLPSIPSDWLTAAGLNADAVTEIVDAVVARFSDDTGTAQAGGSTTITLRSGAVATDDYYKDAIVTIYGGTGDGQSRKITGYVGSTKVATVDSAWAVNPDNTSTYFVIGRSV